MTMPANRQRLAAPAFWQNELGMDKTCRQCGLKASMDMVRAGILTNGFKGIQSNGEG
jgi:hypothetical protein